MEHDSKENYSDLHYTTAGHRAGETAAVLPCKVMGSPPKGEVPKVKDCSNQFLHLSQAQI